MEFGWEAEVELVDSAWDFFRIPRPGHLLDVAFHVDLIIPKQLRRATY